jgi:acyl-coenzyme A synthetase/AMP-(fatty) acid ligase
MNLNIVGDDGTVTKHIIREEDFSHSYLEGHIGYIGAASKESNALNILKAYFSNAKVLLFDESNQTITELIEKLNIPPFETLTTHENIFNSKAFSSIYFTSGSTGHPAAALKTKMNIESEVRILSILLQKYQIKKVIVTVPFIHLYGTLLGLMYPMLNGIDVYIKEHFMPNDLLELMDEHTLVVTTPLYIKALNKMEKHKDLSKSLFVSSTAPLDHADIITFNHKFNTSIMQIFGSTETGGIAYKIDDEALWLPFEQVEIDVNTNDELKVKSPFISDVIYENGFKKTFGEIQTFDYVEIKEERFKLIGRSSKIFKLAGKRYSTIQIENILESLDDVKNVLVFVERDKESLRGEYLDISIESTNHRTAKEIKTILKQRLSNLKFSIKLHYVDKIPTNQVGKKLRIT